MVHKYFYIFTFLGSRFDSFPDLKVPLYISRKLETISLFNKQFFREVFNQKIANTTRATNSKEIYNSYFSNSHRNH